VSCDICGRSSCIASFHSLVEQEQYSDVIEAFKRARRLRARTRALLDEWASAVLDAIVADQEPVKGNKS